MLLPPPEIDQGQKSQRIEFPVAGLKFPHQHPFRQVFLIHASRHENRSFEKRQRLAREQRASDGSRHPASRQPQAGPPPLRQKKRRQHQDPQIPRPVHPRGQAEARARRRHLPPRRPSLLLRPRKEQRDQDGFGQQIRTALSPADHQLRNGDQFGEHRRQPGFRMPQPNQRPAEQHQQQAHHRKAGQRVLIPAANPVQPAQQPFPPGAVIHHVFRPHHHNLGVRLVSERLGHMPPRVAARQKAIADDFQADQKSREQCGAPADQGHITLNCGAIVHFGARHDAARRRRWQAIYRGLPILADDEGGSVRRNSSGLDLTPSLSFRRRLAAMAGQARRGRIIGHPLEIPTTALAGRAPATPEPCDCCSFSPGEKVG